MFISLNITEKTFAGRDVLAFEPNDIFTKAYPDIVSECSALTKGSSVIAPNPALAFFSVSDKDQELQFIGPNLIYNHYPRTKMIGKESANMQIQLYLLDIIRNQLEPGLKLVKRDCQHESLLACEEGAENDPYIWSRAIYRAINNQVIAEVINGQRDLTPYIFINHIVPGLVMEMGMGLPTRRYNQKERTLIVDIPLLDMRFEVFYPKAEMANKIDAPAKITLNDKDLELSLESVVCLVETMQANSPIPEESKAGLNAFWQRILDLPISGPAPKTP